MLIDFRIIAGSDQPTPKTVKQYGEDNDGSDTIKILQLARGIAGRITGNDSPSLGLHPAVYFYNERGVYSRHLFLGMVKLITEKVRNNDPLFFKKFTKARSRLEKYLIENKSLITRAYTKLNRDARVVKASEMLATLIEVFYTNKSINIDQLLASVGITGHILDVRRIDPPVSISTETKSALFLRVSLEQAPKCPLCDGFLYPRMAVSFDHKIDIKRGGRGDLENAQMTHPYCNSIKD